MAHPCEFCGCWSVPPTVNHTVVYGCGTMITADGTRLRSRVCNLKEQATAKAANGNGPTTAEIVEALNMLRNAIWNVEAELKGRAFMDLTFPWREEDSDAQP